MWKKNMKMEKTQEGYGAKSCLKLILKKFKEMRSFTFIYTPMKTQLKEASKEAFMCALNKNTS